MPPSAIVHLKSCPTLGVWVDGMEFFYYLSKTYPFVDCITYTLGMQPLRLKIRRLIIGTRDGLRLSYIPKCEDYCIYSNLHTKLFLGYTDPLNPVAYLGSHNLSASQNEELMIRVTDAQQTQFLYNYFDELWSNSKHKP